MQGWKYSYLNQGWNNIETKSFKEKDKIETKAEQAREWQQFGTGGQQGEDWQGWPDDSWWLGDNGDNGDDGDGDDNCGDGDGDDGDCLEGRRLARLATDWRLNLRYHLQALFVRLEVIFGTALVQSQFGSSPIYLKKQGV